MFTNFVVFSVTAEAAMVAADHKTLGQLRTFFKVDGDRRIMFQEGANRISDAVETGNPLFTDQFQALVQDRRCEPWLQLDSFQDWKKYRDFFVAKVVHVVMKYQCCRLMWV